MKDKAGVKGLMIMKRFSKTILGMSAAVLMGVAVFVAVERTSMGRDTNPMPQFNVQNTPVNRQTGGVTSYAPIIKKASPSVVNISSTRTIHMRQTPFMDPFRFFGPGFSPFDNQDDGNGQSQSFGGGGNHSMREQSLGSGVIISSDGYVLTANHVVEGADPNGVTVQMTTNGKKYNAKVVGTDPPTDVAVLKIDATDLPAITMADSDKIEVGDVVLAIGQPFGLPHTVTMGIVSAVGRSLGIYGEGSYEDFIQTDAAINQGNSGGALIDAEGRLIGLNTAIFSPSGGNAGIGFAVPINLARGVMERLIQYGKVTRGFLGVGIDSVSSDMARKLKLPDQKGAVVTEVNPNTPAARAGLQPYDVIREVNGKTIDNDQQLRLYISQQSPGAKADLKVLRSKPGGKPAEEDVTVTLGTLPGNLAQSGRNNGGSGNENGSIQDALDGVEVADLDSNARRQYRIPSNVRGALVTSVDQNSPSAEAGLHEGDVIQEIDRQPVRNANQAVDLSEKVASEKEVMLRVWHNQGNGNGGGSVLLMVENPKATE